MGNHLHTTFLGKDWFCFSFCWEKNWKHRYVLKALCQNCNPKLLFPWSPILQRNTLPNIKEFPSQGYLGGAALWEKDTLHPLLFHQSYKETECFRPLPAPALKKALLCEIWQGMAELERACSFPWIAPLGPLFLLRNYNLSPPSGPFVFKFGMARIGRLKICTFAQIQITLSSLINFFNIGMFSCSECQGRRDYLTIIWAIQLSFLGEKVAISGVLSNVLVGILPPSPPL